MQKTLAIETINNECMLEAQSSRVKTIKKELISLQKTPLKLNYQE